MLAVVIGRVRTRPLAAATLALAGISLIGILIPMLDIAVSRLFYRPGVGFPAADNPTLLFLRATGMRISNIAIIALVAAALWGLFRRPHFAVIRPRVLVFLASSMALGPGLLVNTLLKDHWGRARPVQTDLFGGSHPFTLPWVISDGCDRNCSFVSGEASGSFWFIALAFVVPIAWRRRTAIAALAWTFVMSLNRIAFGGHYLSDVLIGWALVLVVILAARDLVLIRWGEAIDQ